MAGHSEWDMVVDAIAGGRICVAPLISHAVPLDDAPELFDDLLARRQWSNKVLFAVSAAARAEAAEQAVRELAGAR